MKRKSVQPKIVAVRLPPELESRVRAMVDGIDVRNMNHAVAMLVKRGLEAMEAGR